MIITLLEELPQKRIKVHIDGEFAFVLYKGELRLFGIKSGEPIKEDIYDNIVNCVLPKRAKLRAMNLLKSRDYTRKQMYDKLRDGLYPEGIILEALEYVSEYHYIDDLRYAVSFIGDHEATRSRRRIEQDLLNRGIDRKTLGQAWLEWEEQGGCQDELTLINKLLEKRHYRVEESDNREYQKTYAFLARKGFSGEMIRKALKKEWLE